MLFTWPLFCHWWFTSAGQTQTWSTWNNETIIHISYLTMTNKIKYLFFGEFITNIQIILGPLITAGSGYRPELNLKTEPDTCSNSPVYSNIARCGVLVWCLDSSPVLSCSQSPRSCFLCCHSHGPDSLNKRETSQVPDFFIFMTEKLGRWEMILKMYMYVYTQIDILSILLSFLFICMDTSCLLIHK